MIPLCCYKSQKAQAVICIGAGLGGLVTALVWFYNYSVYSTAADSYYYSSYYYVDSYGNFYDPYATMATVFLVIGNPLSFLTQF
jgi:hypothetical protein